MPEICCHTDKLCHERGEDRQRLINEIKICLDKLDDKPCLVQESKREEPPMMEYPGYVNTRHKKLLPDTVETQGFSCHRPCHRFRICPGSSEPVDHDPNIPEALDYLPPPEQLKNPYDNACTRHGMDSPGKYLRVRNQSVELQGGTIYGFCDCPKRNGLQDQCPRKDCRGSPKCIAYNPGPCCLPALARRKYDN